MAFLDEIFGHTGALTGDLTVWQECARAVLIFGCGFLLIRLSGRRIFAKWSALDVIVPVIAGSALSRAMTGHAPLWGTLIATALLFALHALLARACARSERLSRLLEGRAIVLGRDGTVDEGARRRHGVSDADLDQALGEQGVDEVGDTRRVRLQPNGKITVVSR